jgi:hypothetical protein
MIVFATSPKRPLTLDADPRIYDNRRDVHGPPKDALLGAKDR